MKQLDRFVTGFNFNSVILTILSLYLGTTFFSVAIANILLAISAGIFLLGLVIKKIALIELDWKTYLLIVSPYILTILSVLNSENTNSGLWYLSLRLPIMLVPLLMLPLKLKNEDINKALKTYVLLSFLASCATIYNAIKYFNEDILFKTEFTHFITVIQHPYFGIYLLIAIASILEYKLFKNKTIKVIALLTLSVAISLTTSRVVYLLYFVILGVYLFKSLPKVKFAIGILTMGILGSIFLLTNNNIQDKFRNSFNYDKSPRLKLWANSLEVVKSSDSYWLGLGIGDYYAEKKDPYFAEGYGELTFGAYGYNPHSQPLEFFITNGVLGMVLLLIALYLFFIKMKYQNSFARIVFISIFVFSLTECIFNRQYGVQLYSVLFPLIFMNKFSKTTHEGN